MIDRLSIRTRPPGAPVMHQSWGKLLFMHWALPVDRLRPLVPRRLSIDTFEGAAWIGVVPFTMWGIRPPYVPPLPGLSRSHELNVRTYVHLDGVPGVWFLSLDAAHPLVVWGARLVFHLPYFIARMELKQDGATIHYRSRRTHRGAPPAVFDAVWTIGEALPQAQPGSLEFFLTERYCLYAVHKGALYRTRIFHPPWPLRRAGLERCASTMVEAHGLPTSRGAPLLHYAESLHVAVWPPRRVVAPAW